MPQTVRKAAHIFSAGNCGDCRVGAQNHCICFLNGCGKPRSVRCSRRNKQPSVCAPSRPQCIHFSSAARKMAGTCSLRKQFPIRSIILRSKGTLSGFKHTALQQSAFARPWYLWKGHKTIWRKAAQRNCVDQSPACQSRRPLSGVFSQNGNDASPVLRRSHQFPRTVSVRETQNVDKIDRLPKR